MKTIPVAIFAWSLASTCTAFVAPGTGNARTTRSGTVAEQLSSSALTMAPRFDASTQRWYPSSEEESSEAGYPPIRSLLRHGPQPFFIRLTQPDEYDQAVLKFMATENCDRNEGQGNMDRYFDNPNDWAFERIESQRKGVKRDYVSINKKQVILSSIWAGIVLWFANQIVLVYIPSYFK